MPEKTSTPVRFLAGVYDWARMLPHIFPCRRIDKNFI
jgi:hypothetical protein